MTVWLKNRHRRYDGLQKRGEEATVIDFFVDDGLQLSDNTVIDFFVDDGSI
jgi:hypothetical protein